MCALQDLVSPTVWNASVNKWWRLKQSIQLVHVPPSSLHNAVLRTQLDKVCYYTVRGRKTLAYYIRTYACEYLSVRT